MFSGFMDSWDNFWKEQRCCADRDKAGRLGAESQLRPVPAVDRARQAPHSPHSPHGQGAHGLHRPHSPHSLPHRSTVSSPHKGGQGSPLSAFTNDPFLTSGQGRGMGLRRMSVGGEEHGRLNGENEDSQTSPRGRSSMKDMSFSPTKRSSLGSVDSKEHVTVLPAKDWKQPDKSMGGRQTDDAACSDVASSVSSLDDDYMAELKELEQGMQEALDQRKQYYSKNKYAADSHIARAVDKYLSGAARARMSGQEQDPPSSGLGGIGEEELSGQSPASGGPGKGNGGGNGGGEAAPTTPANGARVSMMEAATTTGGPQRDEPGYGPTSASNLDTSNANLGDNERVENMWYDAKYCRNNGKLGQKLPHMAEERKQAFQRAAPARNPARSKRDPVEKLKQAEVDKYYSNMRERFKKLDSNEHDMETEQFPETSDPATAVLGGILKYHKRCEELGRFYTFQADDLHHNEASPRAELTEEEIHEQEKEREAREQRRQRRLDALPGLLKTLQGET